MANEGHLGKTTLSGERAATDDHPVIIHALPLADGLTDMMQPGTLLKRVEVKDGANKVVGYAFKPWLATDTDAPKAVVDKPCDPTVEKSAISVVHGCVKTHLLKVGTTTATAPDMVALEKLKDCGIFTV